ncbi:MAG: hypothetical protein ACI9W2_004468 [Gammaproteobacteria bacterium]|jgi:hypothetical protein
MGLMGLMKPNYIEGRTLAAESMRRLLFAATADGDIAKEEKEAFEKFFGDGTLSDSLNLDALADDLNRRTEKVKGVATVAQAT